MEPAVFSLAGVFGEEAAPAAGGACEGPPEYEVRQHDFPGKALLVREFGFHRCNANLAWPGARVFADWLHARRHLLHGRRILELGSGTGALAVYLASVLGADVTTCDYDDIEIEENIAFNCHSNGLAVLPHVRRTLQILGAYSHSLLSSLLGISSLQATSSSEYGNLIKTLTFLLRKYQRSGTEELAAKMGQSDDNSERSDHRSCDAFGWEAELPLPAAMRQGQRGCAEGLGLAVTTLNPDYRYHGAATGQEAEGEFPSEEASVAGPDTSASMQSAGRGPHLAVANGRVVIMGVEIDGLARLPIPSFLMSWRRRLPKTETDRFFGGCGDAGLVVKDLGSAVFLVH
eukprot:SM000028S10208  [mRNA]  locus=s28:929670:931602:+ [translate_table: standard]